MATLTGANAVVAISVTNLFPIPVQLQGFQTDDSFDVEEIEPNEVLMGVDGLLSGGRVFVAVPMTIMLQADSPSNSFFDQWNAAEQAVNDSYIANGIVRLNAVGGKWALTRGFLTRFKPIPAVKKLIQPRHFRITWNIVSVSPV